MRDDFDVETVGWGRHEFSERRAGRRIRWASSRRHRRLVLDDATALRHLLSPWRKMTTRVTRATRGEERSQEEEEEGTMGSGRRKCARFITCFSKLPVSRPMISSADEDSIPRSPQQLHRFHVGFNLHLQISTITWPSGNQTAKKRSESCPLTIGLPQLQGDFTIETLYNT